MGKPRNQPKPCPRCERPTTRWKRGVCYACYHRDWEHEHKDEGPTPLPGLMTEKQALQRKLRVAEEMLEAGCSSVDVRERLPSIATNPKFDALAARYRRNARDLPAGPPVAGCS